jgi:hypothetical protein
MIKSAQHARKVQERRADSGKRFIAHAVRRFINRTGNPAPESLPVNYVRRTPTKAAQP